MLADSETGARKWLPYSLPFALLTAMVLLYLGGRTESHESPALLLALNVVCTTMVSSFIAVLAGRSFLATGQPSLLAIAVGMLVWGGSALVAVLGKRVGNYNITIHNLGLAV